MFATGLLIGLFIGMFIGWGIASVLVAAGRADRIRERENRLDKISAIVKRHDLYEVEAMPLIEDIMQGYLESES